MRVAVRWSVLSMLALACSGGQAAAPPSPHGLRAKLQFARNPGRVRYEVHDHIRRSLFGAFVITTDQALFITEVTEDSLDAHLIRVRIDSGRPGPKAPIRLGPYPGFMGWFNNNRDRLDTLASDLSVEEYRASVFNGMMPLPVDSVSVGDVWTSGSRPRASVFRIPEGPIHATAHGVVKSLNVVDGDTIAVLELRLEVKGKFTPRNGGNDVEVHGEEKGDETFSVSRGVTLTMAMKGELDWDTDAMGPRGLERRSVIVRNEFQRTLIP